MLKTFEFKYCVNSAYRVILYLPGGNVSTVELATFVKPRVFKISVMLESARTGKTQRDTDRNNAKKTQTTKTARTRLNPNVPSPTQ